MNFILKWTIVTTGSWKKESHHTLKLTWYAKQYIKYLYEYICLVFFGIFQIFLPINIPDTQCYLGVINAKKWQIQVIDSFGPAVGHAYLKDYVSN
jgi:hypothetical protein